MESENHEKFPGIFILVPVSTFSVKQIESVRSSFSLSLSLPLFFHAPLTAESCNRMKAFNLSTFAQKSSSNLFGMADKFMELNKELVSRNKNAEIKVKGLIEKNMKLTEDLG